MKYDYKPRPIYLCPNTGRKSHVRTSNDDMCFDSTSEYNCYKMLCHYLPECDVLCQYPVDVVGITQWKCDFYVVAQSYRASYLLGYLMDFLNNAKHRNTKESGLLIEYKGVIDDTFKGKMQTLAKYDTELFEGIVVLSNNPMALHIEELSKLKSYTKLIHSIDFFKKLIGAYSNGK